MAQNNPAPTAPRNADVSAATPVRKPGRLTVDELRASVNPPAWQHAAANVLHGWAEHAHATGKAMRLSGEDYAKALEAASRPARGGDYAPHPAALGDTKREAAKAGGKS